MICFHFSGFRFVRLWKVFAWLLLLLVAVPGLAQTCKEGSELDPAARSAIESTATLFQSMSVRGDVAGLRASSIPALAGNFSGIEQAVFDNKEGLSGPATIRKIYLLDAPGTATIERAEFFCGVFGANGNTPNSAGFVLPNLPPGRYAVAILDINGPKGPYVLSEVLQQLGDAWKLAGYYAKPTQVGGHDSDWFAQKAREFKQKGQMHNAWFYLIEARELAAPVPFMSTLKLDRLYEEAEGVRPVDLPTDSPVNANFNTRTYKLLSAFPVVVSEQFDLVVKYQASDISNTAQTFQDNTALMKAMVLKFPELRDGFSAIVARAVAPDGKDYGTLLAMKDIK